MASVAMPNYSNNPATAFQEITEDYQHDYVAKDVLGKDLTVKVVSTKKIRHRGRDALYQEMEATPEYTFIYCVSYMERMVILSPHWSARQITKRAYVIVADQCKENHRYDRIIERSMRSFRSAG